VLGTCLILQYSIPGSLIGKVLSAKPIVATGLLSYSLYLWHFPIFAFARIKNSSPSDSDKLGWIALTIGLSILFYFLVEKPFRQNRNMPIRSALLLIAGGGVAAMLLCGITLGANGFSSRLPAIFVDEHFTQEPWHDLKDDTGRICYDTQEGCIFTPKSTDAQRIAVIGDSHLTILANDLKNRLRDDNALYFSLLGGCPLYIEASRYNSKDIRSEKCNIETQAARMDRILTFRPDITILMARYPVSVEGKWFDNQEGGIESTGFLTIKDAQGNPAIGKAISLSMEKLLQSGSEIILIYPMPEVGWDVPKKLMAERPKNFWEFDAYLKDKPITTSYAVYQQRTKTSFAILDQIKSDQITRLYPHKLFCNTQLEGRCVTHDSTHLFYRDDDHPSAFAAGMINDLIIAEIEVAAKR
ncbi:MAG: acyltransferase family protein, partial [Parvularculaceae bacterium]